MATATVPQVPASLERTKPPFLRRVRIAGYKSIVNCDVALEPLTILVGPNASGKSNFLDALAFLRDLMDMRATEAVNQRQGWRSIHCRSGRHPHIAMGFESTFDSFNSSWDAEYSFSLEIAEHNQIRVHRERLILNDRERDRQCGFECAAGEIEWIGREHFEETLFSESKLPSPALFTRRRYDRLLLSVIGTQPFLDVSERLRAACVYNFSPAAMREHQPITAMPILGRNGANLARAIEGLREIEPKTVQRIGRYLRSIVPGVKEFRKQEYGDYETVRFLFEAKNGRPALEFDASSMSDGTLRILASLVAAFQIVLPAGFPGFIGIEEPETALHPAAMRALVDALDEATLRTQILLTTHSAEMLDNPTIRPENIRVVQMIDGQTVIGPVDAASVEIVRQKLDTLGGLERQNQLEPDLDDQDRQRQLALNGREPKT